MKKSKNKIRTKQLSPLVHWVNGGGPRLLGRRRGWEDIHPWSCNTYTYYIIKTWLENKHLVLEKQMPADKTQKNEWVVRIPRSDNANEFVLVHISSSGKAALDLKLIATEGENPYVGSRTCSHSSWSSQIEKHHANLSNLFSFFVCKQ